MLLTRTLVGQQELDIYDLGDRWVAHRPGVAGTEVADGSPEGADGIAEVPDRIYPFNGYLVPMGISIREANGIVRPPSSQDDPLGELGHHIRGICRWQITMNGQVVYSPEDQAVTLRDSLLQAGGALQALVAQMERTGVRWWDESSWRGRPVWYQGVEALIMVHDAQRGLMFLVPEAVTLDDEMLVRDFPRTPSECERGPVPRAMHGVWVDLLDTAVGWARTRTRNPINTPSDTGLVQSPDDSSGEHRGGSAPPAEPSTATSDGSDIPGNGGVDDQRGPDQDEPGADAEGSSREG